MPRADTAIFFLLFYLDAWLGVDPRLIQHGIGILTWYHPFSFQTGWGALVEHLGRPGGLAEYATRLLSPLYGFGWLGALILTAPAWLGCMAMDELSRLVGRTPDRVMRFVPAILLLVLYGGYGQSLAVILSLLGALMGFVLYARWAPDRAVTRLLLLLAGSLLVYQAAGAGGLLFPLLVTLGEFFVWRRLKLAVAAFLCILCIPWIVASAFSLDGWTAYLGFLFSNPGLPPTRRPATLALYLSFPGALVGSLLAEATVRRRTAGGRGRNRAARSRPGNDGLSRWSHEVRRAAPTVLVGCVAAAAAWWSLDRLTRTVLEIDDHSQREEWPEVLDAARRLPKGLYHVRSFRNIVLALYGTGRLGDELFRYAQEPGVDLFSTPARAWDAGAYFQESRLFLALGQVNQAEKCASEALEVCGDLPAILEELARINVVKGRPEAARIYLRALRLRPFQRDRAEAMLDELEADPTMQRDARVAAIRTNNVARDYVASDTSVEDFLQTLLEKNPHNRMAFEFLVTHALQVGRPDKVAVCMDRLKDFSYRQIPRHWQEALVLRAQMTRHPPAVPGYELDPAVLRRAGEFARILASSRSEEEAAKRAREAGFGDSYFFYFNFGTSGL